jgi:hypothetical protein
MATVDPQASEVQLKTGLEFRRFVASEIKQNVRLVEAAGLKPE